DVEVRRAVHRVATDADAGGLSHTARRELPDGFVGERSAARDHAHVAALVDVARRDADAAAAVRILARPRRDDTRAIRPDQPRPLAFHRASYLDHVLNPNAYRDATDQVKVFIHRFEDHVGGEVWGNKDRRIRLASLPDRLGHLVENGNLV